MATIADGIIEVRGIIGGMKKNSALKPWLYSDTVSEKFMMLPPELLEEPAFQNLTHAARMFYIVLNTHYVTETQRSSLSKTLTEYNELLHLGLTREDIRNEAYCTSKSKYIEGYFVIPQSHLKLYGYSPQYANKLKKELIFAGFIEIVYGGKGKSKTWDKNVTVYRFSNAWKKCNQKD